jgi:hypothetical protein
MPGMAIMKTVPLQRNQARSPAHHEYAPLGQYHAITESRILRLDRSVGLISVLSQISLISLHFLQRSGATIRRMLALFSGVLSAVSCDYQ